MKTAVLVKRPFFQSSSLILQAIGGKAIDLVVDGDLEEDEQFRANDLWRISGKDFPETATSHECG